MAKQNLAYKTQPIKRETESRELRVFKNEKIQKRRRYALKVCVYLIALLSVFTIVYMHMAIAEVSYKINQTNNYLKEAKSESIRLQASMDSTVSHKNIESKASSMFGLSKEDKSQVEYVSLPKDNFAVISSNNSDFVSKAKMFVSKILEYINGIFNNN